MAQAGSTSAITSRRLTELAPKYLAGEFPVSYLVDGRAPTHQLFTARRAIAGRPRTCRA